MNSEKLIVYFDAVPINPAVDPRGGYAMKMKEQQIVSGNSVFEEVVLTKTLPFSADLLEFAFECVLTTMADRVSRDCRPRKIGKHLKAAAYLRGRLDSPYGLYDPKTHSCAIIFTSLSGVTKTANTDKYVRFVNTKTGTKVVIDRIVYEGCVDSSQIATLMRGKGIAVTGLNCQWLEGDSCTLAWKDADGVEHTAEIVPTSSTVTEMHFPWPTELADVPAGSEIEMRFRTRGGIEDAEPQLNSKNVTLIETELVPTVTKVATDGSDGIVKGQAFEAVGANLGFNFATDHVSVTWTDSDGAPRQAAIVPLSATAEKIAFSTCPLFDDLEDGTALEFTFEIGGKTAAKSTMLCVPAPTVSISKVKTGSVDGKIVLDEDQFQIVGEHLEKLEGDTLKVKGTSDQGSPVEYLIPYATYTCNGDGTQLTVQITEAMRDAFYSGWTWDEVTLEYTSHAGVAGSAAQVTTGTAEVTNE